MTRPELALLSEAHAVAYVAMAAYETGRVPVDAAEALVKAARAEMPGFVEPCEVFLGQIRTWRHHTQNVVSARKVLRDQVARAMAFRPVDAERVDIHG